MMCSGNMFHISKMTVILFLQQLVGSTECSVLRNITSLRRRLVSVAINFVGTVFWLALASCSSSFYKESNVSQDIVRSVFTLHVHTASKGLSEEFN